MPRGGLPGISIHRQRVGRSATPLSAPAPQWPGCLLVLVTGGASLAGQVSWARLAAPAVGGSFTSSVITLSSAMTGLALGAALGGQLSSKWGGRNLLLGVILAGATLLAAMPWLLLGVAGLEGSLATRRVLSAVFLAVGHTPFGAILPCTIAWLGISTGRLATKGGLLYALGAVGAAAGALAIGEFLAALLALDHLGLLLSFVTVLAAAVVLFRPLPATTAPSLQPPSTDRSLPVTPMGVALGLGFLGMAVETVWIRLLGFYWEANTLTFAWVTAGHVLGLAAGALGAGALARRFRIGPRGVAGSLGIAAFCLPCAASLAHQAVTSYSIGDRAALALSLVAFPAALSGASYILLLGSLKAIGHGGRTLGFVVGANSIGAAAAPLAVWLASPILPWPARILGFLGCGYAGLILCISPLRLREKGAALALAGTLGFVAWTAVPSAPARGSFRPVSLSSPIPGFNESVRIDVRTGLESTVAVTRNTETGTETLWIDRGSQGDTSEVGRRLPELLGRFPCRLLNRPSRKSMVIGLGMGMTVSAMVDEGARSVEVAELSRNVIEANRTTLADTNGNILERDGVRVHAADGRTFLADTKGLFDLIVADMVYPGLPGAGNLFSSEFYDLVRRRLAPDGLFVHWIPCFLVSPEDLSAVVAAFRESFPEGTGWIASIDPRTLILGLAGGAVPEALPPDVRARRVLDSSELARMSNGARPIRDGDPRLEYRSHAIRADRTFGALNLIRLTDVLRHGDSMRRGWYLLGESRQARLDADGAPPHSREWRLHRNRAERLCREAASAQPALPDAAFFLRIDAYERGLEAAAEASARGRHALAVGRLRKAATHSPDGSGHLRLADALASEGRFEEALKELGTAAARSPKSSDVRLKEAIVACAVLDYARARSALAAAGELRPDRPPIFREISSWIRATTPSGRAD